MLAVVRHLCHPVLTALGGTSTPFQHLADPHRVQTGSATTSTLCTQTYDTKFHVDV
jgi:hypothetical protein